MHAGASDKKVSMPKIAWHSRPLAQVPPPATSQVSVRAEVGQGVEAVEEEA